MTSVTPMEYKYPVPRLARQIEDEWSEALSAHLGSTIEAFRSSPEGHMSYPHDTVRVELDDGSHVQFKYAFALVQEEAKAIAVFTEHCGHFVFPYHGAKVYRNGALEYQNEA